MNAPWIELTKYQDPDEQAGLGFFDYSWQAVFACQVVIRTHEEWAKLRWGFNAAVLFEEAMERQRLFLESQYAIRNELKLENPEHRTVAFRFIQRPGDGLMMTILGKIHARTEEEAAEMATAFCRELYSTFPYDYSLAPACTKEEFLHMSGRDILDPHETTSHLAQIKRVEIPAVPDRKSPFLHGLWQSSPRGHEPIWRSLSSSPHPLLMNVSLRPTVLYDMELTKLVQIAGEIAEIENDLVNHEALAARKQWSALYTERRLDPWKKYFYLQIHVFSRNKIEENLFRIVGTSLTLGKDKHYLPGYQVVAPRPEDVTTWRKKITNLDLVLSRSRLAVSRLSDVVDMEEVFAVVRIPYSPPDKGFPGLRYATPGNI